MDDAGAQVTALDVAREVRRLPPDLAAVHIVIISGNLRSSISAAERRKCSSPSWQETENSRPPIEIDTSGMGALLFKHWLQGGQDLIVAV